jgi:hypothetical protein
MTKSGKHVVGNKLASLLIFECGGTIAGMEKKTIDQLYPGLNDDQLRQAEDNLEQYLLVVLNIYERIAADPESYAKFRTLTASIGTLPCTPPRSSASKGHNSHIQR